MNTKRRRIINAILILALLFATGCFNKVKFQDEKGNEDFVVLPQGYLIKPPAIIRQTESNITVTIIYKMRTL